MAFSKKSPEPTTESQTVESTSVEVIPSRDAVVSAPGMEGVPALTSNQRQTVVAELSSLAELREHFGSVQEWEELSPSFRVVKDKSLLEDVPFVLGGFRFHDSDKFFHKAAEGDALIPSTFVSMLVATYDTETENLTSKWFILNDGGTGIKEQLWAVSEKYDRDETRVPPIVCQYGLRRSDYQKELPDGSVVEATTWYIS